MSSAARLQLFGVPTLAHDGSAWALPLERRSQLLVLLALKRGWVGRGEVAAMLWPEHDNKLAHGNLRKTLFRLDLLPWGRCVQSQGGALCFDGETDVAAFDAALREERLADALALRQGELLSGFDDDANEAWTGWLAYERERQRAAWRSAALAWLDGEVPAPAAVALSAQLLEAEPLDETALRQHVAWLVRSGQQVAARQVCGRFVERLADELGLAPGAALQALQQSLQPASAPAATPAAASPVAAAVAPAPAGDAGFIGRSAELRRIVALLAQEDCRVLCLLGPGGVGKTRLARRALQDLAPAFAQGAVFVTLEDVHDAAGFGERLVRELQVRPAGRGDALSQAIAALQGRQMLLVLDNAETLADGAALLQRLLHDCSGIKLLVTSRARLAVAGEWTLGIEGLPCPDAEDLDRLDAFDAVRLFERSARRVAQGFVATAEAAAIVEICRLVEGLPLALELAAAWVRVLPCAEIAAELRAGSELLQAQDPSQPRRHASIEQVFDQSWRQLAATEREALARLSVFRGGFTLAAARAVAAASMPVLGALADKSLLSKEADRMRLHPLVQQLAAVRLAGTGGQAAAEAEHMVYFQRWLQQRKRGAEGGDRETLQAIDAEFENCRQAWNIAVAQGRADALAHSAPTLLDHFEHRARFEEGLAFLAPALAAPIGRADNRLRALLLSQASLLELRLGRYDTARQSALQALAAVPETAGHDRRAMRDTRYQALSVLAGCALTLGQPAEGRRLYKQALLLARAGALLRNIAATLENLALCEKRLGHYDAALQLSIEALAQHRNNGDNARVALCLSNLGSMYLVLHEAEAAAAHLHEALGLSERHGLVSTHAFVLANLTELAMQTHATDAARQHAERALEIAERTGMRPLAGWLKVQLARLAARRGEPGAAREPLAAAAGLALALGAQTLKAAVLLGLAELLEAQQHPDLARRVLAFGVDEATLSTPDRDELRAEWARRAATLPADAPWPGIALDALLQRIVAEAPLAHAPLLALLQLTHAP